MKERSRVRTRAGMSVAVLFMLVNYQATQAAYISVYNGPNYTSFSGWISGVSDDGIAVGTIRATSDFTTPLSSFYWSASAGPTALPSPNSGSTHSTTSIAMNLGGIVGGWISGPSASAPVRWTAWAAQPQLLDDAGLGQSGGVNAINPSGTAVGYLSNSGPGRSAQLPVLWNAGTTAATVLGHLGTDSAGLTETGAVAINATGVIVGNAEKYDAAGNWFGKRGVRWDAGTTSASELQSLGTNPDGSTLVFTTAINDAGMIVGQARKYDAGGNYLGDRAVLWAAGGTAVTELGHLGVNPAGETYSYASGINSDGTIIGTARLYDGDGNGAGDRAVTWTPAQTAAAELADMGLSSSGQKLSTFAARINEAGMIVGSCEVPTGGKHAVYWQPDGAIVDLNDLIDPSSGMVLMLAQSISDTGWIAGIALDPSVPPAQFGRGNRLFLLQVPEPATLAMAVVGAMLCLRRSQRSRVTGQR